MYDPGNTLPPVDTLKTLQEEYIPFRDLFDIGERLEGKLVESNLYPDTLAPYRVGDHKKFWIVDTDNDQSFQVDTTLQFRTDQVYYWIQDGISFNERELEELAIEFEYKILPTNRNFFGNEWSPGIDGDPRLHIVYVSGLGGTVAGLFSSGDEYPPTVSEFSNSHEMFLLNADQVD